jgi:3'(2'), 5'-bisphosphate nucleotidase
MVDLCELALASSKEAGFELIKFFRSSIIVRNKLDGTPVTKADQRSNDVIFSYLSKSKLPVISEESVNESNYKKFPMYWLIDPLDGTKEYISKSKHFTINIALIENQKPVLGVLYAPAMGLTFVGGVKIKPYLLFKEKIILIKKKKSFSRIMIKSHFHSDNKESLFAKTNKMSRIISMGSALKFGYLAIGKADIYPRFFGSCEWDTAAGQAILEASGGSVLDINELNPLVYGKPNRKNPPFIALGSAQNINHLIF